jgi:hypothetical protein
MPYLTAKIRRTRLYPALALASLTALLLAQYRSKHIPLTEPLLAIAPPPYTAATIHLSATTLPFPDFLQQLTRQSPVPVKNLSPAALAATTLTFPSTNFPLADLPLLLKDNPNPSFTAVFDPETLLLGNDTAIHSAARAVTCLYPVPDLLRPGVLSENSFDRNEDTLADLITHVVAPNSWREQGGDPGTLRFDDATLVITTTPDIHYQVQSLLTALRRR